MIQQVAQVVIKKTPFQGYGHYTDEKIEGQQGIKLSFPALLFIKKDIIHKSTQYKYQEKRSNHQVRLFRNMAKPELHKIPQQDKEGLHRNLKPFRQIKKVGVQKIKHRQQTQEACPPGQQIFFSIRTEDST